MFWFWVSGKQRRRSLHDVDASLSQHVRSDGVVHTFKQPVESDEPQNARSDGKKPLKQPPKNDSEISASGFFERKLDEVPRSVDVIDSSCAEETEPQKSFLQKEEKEASRSFKTRRSQGSRAREHARSQRAEKLALLRSFYQKMDVLPGHTELSVIE